MTSEPLNQYTDICKDAIKGSSADTDFHLNNQKKTSKMLHTCYIFLMWIVSCKVELTKRSDSNTRILFLEKQISSFIV